MVGTIKGILDQSFASSHADAYKASILTSEAKNNQEQVVAQYTAGKTNEALQQGSVRAAYGASGVQMNGTAADVMNSQAGLMNAKIASEASAGTLKTNVLYAQADMATKESNQDLMAGFDKTMAAGLGGFLKGAAAAG